MVRNHESVGNGGFLYQTAEEAVETLGLIFPISDEESTYKIIYQENLAMKARVKKAKVNNFLQELFVNKMRCIFHKNMKEQSSMDLMFAFHKSSRSGFTSRRFLR